MKDGFFILSYKINGIKNLDKDIKLEFYKKTIDESFDTREYNVKGIYGENGTGKSAIITSVKVLKNLMLNRYYLTDSKNKKILASLINKKMNEATFDIEFISTSKELNCIYKYQIKIARDDIDDYYKIVSEELQRRTNTNLAWTNIYTIENGKCIKTIDKYLFDKLNEGNGTEKLREQSFVSNYIYKSIRKEINEKELNSDSKKVSFMLSLLTCINFGFSIYVYLDTNDQYDVYLDSMELIEFINSNKNKEIPEYVRRKAINDEVIDCITTIGKEDYAKFESDKERMCLFIQIFKPNLKKIDIDKRENKDSIECELIFDYGDYRVNAIFESNGVKKLIRLFKAMDAVDKGQLVFIDEFDSNIHDVYLCKLIEYIEEYSKGQLCFTTQSISVMDVLENRKKSLDFLARDKSITSWYKNSHYSASKLYKKGFIDKSPFNIESFDFLKVFGAALDDE